MGPSQKGTNEIGDVRLDIPAHPEFVRIVRLTVAGVAAARDFDVEAIDELQMAVDECCHLLTAGAWDSGGSLAFTFRTIDDALEVEGVGSLHGARGKAPEFSEQILAELSDDYSVSSGDSPRVRFVRRRDAGR